MIAFQTDGVEMPDLDYRLICRWLEEVAAARGYEVGNVNYCFCGDEEILRANREFLGHDYYTDVITFDYSRPGRISGDVLVSLDTVRSNACQIGAGYSRELLRVIVHGVLHLCGIDDKGPGEREVMERHEDESLAMYESLSR